MTALHGLYILYILHMLCDSAPRTSQPCTALIRVRAGELQYIAIAMRLLLRAVCACAPPPHDPLTTAKRLNCMQIRGWATQTNGIRFLNTHLFYCGSGGQIPSFVVNDRDRVMGGWVTTTRRMMACFQTPDDCMS